MGFAVETEKINHDHVSLENGSSLVSGSLYMGSSPTVLSVQVMIIIPDDAAYQNDCLATVHIWMYDMYSPQESIPKMVASVDNARIDATKVNILPLNFPVGGSEELSINVSCKDQGSYQPGKMALEFIITSEHNADESTDKTLAINIVDTKFEACWNILGARNILLTDPPIRNIGFLRTPPVL